MKAAKARNAFAAGRITSVLRDEFVGATRNELRSQVKTVLITFGGTDQRDARAGFWISSSPSPRLRHCRPGWWPGRLRPQGSYGGSSAAAGKPARGIHLGHQRHEPDDGKRGSGHLLGRAHGLRAGAHARAGHGSGTPRARGPAYVCPAAQRLCFCGPHGSHQTTAKSATSFWPCSSRTGGRASGSARIVWTLRPTKREWWA